MRKVREVLRLHFECGCKHREIAAACSVSPSTVCDYLSRAEQAGLGWEQARPLSDVDRFVLARLEREGLGLSPEASRIDWLRRATFDLTGLPPTPERMESFLADERPDAYERVVEELLASPRYGERYAQRWLDAVRYADTDGFEVNTPRPNAWPYRDYVIEAFARDVPYDLFVREQLCGDSLGKDAATPSPGGCGRSSARKRPAPRRSSARRSTGRSGRRSPRRAHRSRRSRRP